MYEAELDVALDAVTQASALCRAVRATFDKAGVLGKTDRSPVTVADFGAQAVICHAIATAFPDDAIVAEESANVLRRDDTRPITAQVCTHVQNSIGPVTEADILDTIDRGNAPGSATGRFWTCDPIDGTKGFIRGDQYAVALALVENGQVVLGVLGCPNLPFPSLHRPVAAGTLQWAVAGDVARSRPLDGAETTPIAVSSVQQPADAVMCESVEAAHTAHDHAKRIVTRLGITHPSLRIDSQCKYAVVARSEASVYLRLPTRPGYEEKIWDHAAGWVILTAAGGRVSDTNGVPLDFGQGRTLSRNRGVVGTAATIHDDVVRAVVSTASTTSRPVCR